MTPKRREYLIKSSNKEREIRGLIRRCKKALSISKSECNAFNLKPADKKPLEYLEKYIQIQDSKILLQALRHELARLKGMDRVVVPKVTYYLRNNGAFVQRANHCLCGQRLAGGEWYCPKCGRKILWEEVK